MPAGRSTGTGEDDGGFYEEVRLSYPALDVFLVRGVVDRVVATRPDVCTAGGICPGTTREQLRERLAGLTPDLASASPSFLVLCPEDSFLSDYYLRLDYTPEGDVARLELVLDRP